MHTYSCVLGMRSQVDWKSITKLSPIARLVGELLDETKRRFKECWLTNEKIASILGVSVKSVQRALTELSLKGFVSLITNYGLRARRAIQLLWRSEPATLPAVEVASAPHVAPDVAPTPELPCPVEPPPPERPRETPRRPSGPKVREATGQERQLVLKAEAKFGPAMSYPVLLAVDRFGCYWVSLAIEQTPTGYRWSYALKVLEDWQRNGSPPKKAEEQSEDRWERLGRAIQEQWEKCHGIVARA